MTRSVTQLLMKFCYLGILSGLPLAFSSGTLQLWLASHDLSVQALGQVTLLGLPYSIKFLWTPFMEAYYLGTSSYFFWTIITSLAMALILLVTPVLHPPDHLGLIFSLTVLLAFCSASFDAMLDGLRLNHLKPERLGRATSLLVLGYRVGMMLSGGIGLVFVDHWGFGALYTGSAFLMASAPIVILTLGAETTESKSSGKMRDILPAFSDLLTIPSLVCLLGIILTYRFSDLLLGALSSVFLNQVIGYSLEVIGTGYKIIGPLSMMMGVTIGGFLLDRWSLRKVIIPFCFLQGLANLSYLYLFTSQQTFIDLCLVVFIENFFSGLANAALILFLSQITLKLKYKATSYALFTSFIALPRALSGPTAAYCVDVLGWKSFIAFTVFVPLFPMMLLSLYYGSSQAKEESEDLKADSSLKEDLSSS